MKIFKIFNVYLVIFAVLKNRDNIEMIFETVLY
jgi:hypothetical protein